MKLLATSAMILTLGTAGAMAQEVVVPMDGVRASTIEGGEVYSIQTGIEEATFGTTKYTDISTEWDNIGEIEDIVLSPEGEMIGIVAEVGGFLGMGEHEVMLPSDAVHLLSGNDGKYAYVTRLSLDELKALPVIKE
ncbi:PRC-barrel domain-containing protein [Falsirhodobacter sp. alg1]|uniref:PRC-barrel domain-containing protein n=1 Tax=Falsirhodobacter sp. alg1 TaxID=1472418 RepID=UPI0005F01E43|nr:PRC-barrel domain-containing protein [Falsirhodobacter sp. alg1]